MVETWHSFLKLFRLTVDATKGMEWLFTVRTG